ncbi:hypothetical protein HG531_008605 [Fusarium graminearum]|nr:hypothetical protein HG531_008605 [Fusarium graminearum]
MLIRCPDTDGLVLRGRGDVGLLEDGRRPGNVSDPVSVASQGLALLLVGLRSRVKGPDLEDVVAATSDESAVASGTRARSAAHNATGGCSGSPRNGVDAETVSGKGGVVDAVVLELENANVTVGRGAC